MMDVVDGHHPEWSPVVRRGEYTLHVFVLNGLRTSGPCGEQLYAIGVIASPEKGDLSIGFPTLDNLKEFCRECPPKHLLVNGADAADLCLPGKRIGAGLKRTLAWMCGDRG